MEEEDWNGLQISNLKNVDQLPFQDAAQTEIKLLCFTNINTVFPSSIDPLLQNEAKCKPFLEKISFICARIKNHFHIMGIALTRVLKQRQLASH